MSLARLVITAVTVEGRTKSAVARDYGITRFWVQTLVKWFEAEGEAAFEPRSRRPDSSPRAVSLDVENQIVRLRKTLTKHGLDAGAETIATHLATAGISPSIGQDATDQSPTAARLQTLSAGRRTAQPIAVLGPGRTTLFEKDSVARDGARGPPDPTPQQEGCSDVRVQVFRALP